MLNHWIRDLLFHFKKGVILLQFYLVRVFLKKCIICPSGYLANDVNSTETQKCPFFHCINEMTNDNRWQAKFSGFVSCWKQFLSLKKSRSVHICSVLNWSNRDTIVYYRLIFCAFSWPNMVKWRNSGIINTSLHCNNSPLSHGGDIVPGDQKSFVLPRQASPPWFPLRGLAW